MSAKNIFIAEVSISLPHNCEAERWLNLQHYGKESIPLHIKCSKEHVDAAYNLHRVRKINLKFKINKNGDWKLVK